MAKGRLLSRKIATDYNLNALSLEAEFLFLRAIPHLDRDGLITGDPILLWAQVAPRRVELMDKTALLINEWLQQNLVVRYPSPQGPVLLFKAFRKHNLNINYTEEQASEFPPPPGWHRTSCGLIPSDRDLALALAQSLDSRSAYAQQVNRYATNLAKEPENALSNSPPQITRIERAGKPKTTASEDTGNRSISLLSAPVNALSDFKDQELTKHLNENSCNKILLPLDVPEDAYTNNTPVRPSTGGEHLTNQLKGGSLARNTQVLARNTRSRSRSNTRSRSIQNDDDGARTCATRTSVQVTRKIDDDDDFLDFNYIQEDADLVTNTLTETPKTEAFHHAEVRALAEELAHPIRTWSNPGRFIQALNLEQLYAVLTWLWLHDLTNYSYPSYYWDKPHQLSDVKNIPGKIIAQARLGNSANLNNDEIQKLVEVLKQRQEAAKAIAGSSVDGCGSQREPASGTGAIEQTSGEPNNRSRPEKETTAPPRDALPGRLIKKSASVPQQKRSNQLLHISQVLKMS